MCSQLCLVYAGPYSQKVLGLNVLYKCIEFKPKTWLSPFVNTSPGLYVFTCTCHCLLSIIMSKPHKTEMFNFLNS